MEKICTKCKIPKDIEEFHKDKGKKDGRNVVCKSCHEEYMRTYYILNKSKFKEYSHKNKKKTKISNREKLLQLLKKSNCIDCGISDVRVLEFDHLKDKNKSINEMVQTGYSWKTIEEEMLKCEIVCSNCHKIRTYSRTETYRNECT